MRLHAKNAAAPFASQRKPGRRTSAYIHLFLDNFHYYNISSQLPQFSILPEIPCAFYLKCTFTIKKQINEKSSLWVCFRLAKRKGREHGPDTVGVQRPGPLGAAVSRPSEQQDVFLIKRRTRTMCEFAKLFYEMISSPARAADKGNLSKRQRKVGLGYGRRCG